MDNSWIQAGQIHDWSVQFNQFDEDRWVPSPSKRLREDQERTYFAVVVPGFSVLAITGGPGLVEPQFRVSDLTVSPSSPRAHEEFTVSALVTNMSPLASVYPAKLWLNQSVEDAENIVVAAGSSVPFSFTVRKPEGSYTVRLERLIDDFSVEPPLSPAPEPPSVGGTSPGARVLIALIGLAIGLMAGGYRLIVRSR